MIRGDTNPIDAARLVLADAMAAHVFPAAAVEAGAHLGVLWREALGASEDTPFDLASLTKVIATTTLVMQLVDDRRLDLDERVADFFPEWRAADRERVTVQDLLEHASGLSARLLDAPPGGRREFEHDICTMPLEYEPRSLSIYSDLGFILLGFLAADRAGQSLAAQFEASRRLLGGAEPALADEPLAFGLPDETRRRAAPTWPMDEDSRRGRALVGEVHDNCAAALGGIAGHAGLFGTAAGVGAFARAALRSVRGDHSIPPPLSPALTKRFVRKSTVPGSSRALGWDTMLTTSSCGTRMSEAAFGHVGFTGTSLWIDPLRDRYFVLLTNRSGRTGALDTLRSVRRAFHDALADL